MANNNRDKAVKDLVPGDVTPWYTILSSHQEGSKFFFRVLYSDGGEGERVWEDGDLRVPLLGENSGN